MKLSLRLQVPTAILSISLPLLMLKSKQVARFRFLRLLSFCCAFSSFLFDAALKQNSG
jgi:hypothetical protein